MSNSIERFSNRVANYVKYRPAYPSDIIPHIERVCHVAADAVIADIGCGTGLSSKLFLESGYDVIGVEPNAAMRDAALDFLSDFMRFEIVDGTSEKTGLAPNSVDLVVAAQAFHWFEPKKTKLEFQRILKPGGSVALIWNERQLDTTPFLIEYESFLIKYAYDYGTVRHENIEQKELRDFFGKEYTSDTFQNFQDFDFEGLKGRMLSSSYMPNEADEVFEEMIKELRGVFAKHAENGRIRVLYDTNVYTSQG